MRFLPEISFLFPFLVETSFAFIPPPAGLSCESTQPAGGGIARTNTISRKTLDHVINRRAQTRGPTPHVIEKRKDKQARRSTSLLSSASDGDGTEGNQEDSGATFNLDKLKAETKTPFRTLRIFIYGGFGFSAFIGGATALTQLAATLGEQPGALELKQVLINLVVDFGVVALSAFCYNFETKQQAGLEQAEATVRERQRRLEATKITGDVNARRVGKMRMLSVNVPGSQAPDGSASQQAPVGVLMDDASQAFCVLAGGKGYLRDSMVSAMLAKNKIFPNTNLLVVPVDMTEVPGGAFTGGSKGFGKPVPYEQEGYVAAPVHEEDWRELMSEELEAARRQGAGAGTGGDEGIVMLVSKDGKVLRRGLGIPKWEMIRDDIIPPKKEDGNK